MGLLLVCDAPGCMKTIQTVITNGRPSAPKGWWMQGAGECVIVACSDDHLTLAAKTGNVNQ